MHSPSLTAPAGRPAAPHVFVTPVVREMPRPAPEPPSLATTW
jgi:hypothetical protein